MKILYIIVKTFRLHYISVYIYERLATFFTYFVVLTFP